VNISPSLMGSSPLDRRIKGTLLADYCHVTGFYPHDPQLLSRYSSSSSSSSVSNKANPFSLLSLSRDMGQQDKWRKEPTVQNIDMAALVGVPPPSDPFPSLSDPFPSLSDPFPSLSDPFPSLSA
jgi:hypothetical protein